MKLLILREGEFKHISSKEMVLEDEMSTFFKYQFNRHLQFYKYAAYAKN